MLIFQAGSGSDAFAVGQNLILHYSGPELTTTTTSSTTTIKIKTDCKIYISITPPEGGTTSPQGPIIIPECTKATECQNVEAISKTGYAFKYWLMGAISRTENNIEVCLYPLEGNREVSITAVFELTITTTSTTTTTICADGDDDGVCNDVDHCPTVSNPDQKDTDCDGIPDACDDCNRPRICCLLSLYG